MVQGESPGVCWSSSFTSGKASRIVLSPSHGPSPVCSCWVFPAGFRKESGDADLGYLAGYSRES